ncbi:HAD-IC family P-type ATPase, partial [bacterium]|nr:HAD-IC family P-type ATPase [bacterium]
MMWYQWKLEDILDDLESNAETGLSASLAEKKLREFGRNALPEGGKKSWLYFLLSQFKSPLVYILLIGAVLTFVLREWIDMAIILIAVLVNVLVGFWQEFKSNTILSKLKEVVSEKAYVIRDGATREIDAHDVVPGDIITLHAGMKIPADARLISAAHLRIDESLLTGESAEVKKEARDITEERSIGDRFNMVHMGTIVAAGEGKAIVVTTGEDTELGKIAALTQAAEDEPTPLQLRMDSLGRVIAVFVGVAAVVIFVVGLFEGHSINEMFTTAIAVAVAAIPEGMPAAISIVLAVSAQRILRKKGVIKQLVAGETLGSASVICCDKTGTLTEGKMKVKKIICEGAESRALLIMGIANEAIAEETLEGLVFRGETTDRAKLEAFLAGYADRTSHARSGMEILQDAYQRFPKVSFYPFDSVQKFIASLHKDIERGGYRLFVSGAPEVILDLSNGKIDGEGKKTALTKKAGDELRRIYEDLARQGYRLIALGEKSIARLPSGTDEQNTDLFDEATRKNIVNGLSFAGFAVISDPVRHDVKESIALARRAGIRTIMLTGDHLFTARAIGMELGFPTGTDEIMEGSRIENMDDESLSAVVGRVSIFARVSPEHKMRIVSALERRGEVVAMTGDGVNDAPALKSADIGIALGDGTDIAKAASELVLLDNSFTVIVSAIREGRIAFDNIRKVVVSLLAGSFTELILIMGALFLKVPLPVTAAQMLWTNLVEDTLPNIALSFEPGEKGIMDRKPFKKNEPVLDGESKTIIFIIGIFTDVLLLLLFLFLYHKTEMEIGHIQTLIFAVLGLDTTFYVFSIKSLRTPIWKYNILDNHLLLYAALTSVVVIVAAVHLPILNAFLGTIPLSPLEWLLV